MEQPQQNIAIMQEANFFYLKHDHVDAAVATETLKINSEAFKH